jgi:SAM-dependent methyltransferase
MLVRWAIGDELVVAAPQSPYFFDPAVFIAAADDSLARMKDTVSDAVAREALPAAATVLDVGVGAGAASLRLADRAGHLVGVDSSHELLNEFVVKADRLGVACTAVEGRWPDVAETTPLADVVVCHHVVYNVADLAAFAAALTAHASQRVVVELTAKHPMAWMAPYWQAIHGVTQPDEPTVDDALAVLAEMGIPYSQRRWWRALQMIGECDGEATARVARRLCLAANRHDELGHLLATMPPPAQREGVTEWRDSRHAK